MESINDVANVIPEKEEDRISDLPEDIIHRIFSFLDMKYAVQTSTLSKKWKYIWISMTHLSLSSDTFPCSHLFAKFVEHALYHRNTQVSAVDLTFTGPTDDFLFEDIVNYAYLYNAKQLTLKWLSVTVHEFPQCLFSSYTLKHLTLNDQSHGTRKGRIANSTWDFPALETLNFENIRLGDGDKSLDLFPKCVNLKDLTLHNCSMFGLESFTIRAPQLSNLTITEFSVYPKVFEVDAPQLKTLTASVSTKSGGSCFNFLRLSTEGFSSLEKVNLFISDNRFKKENHVPPLLDLFRKLSSAKYLVLDVGIIECLSSCLDQLSNEPCLFNNLKCLKINAVRLKHENRIATIPTQVEDYFFKNSTRTTIIFHFPQVSLAEENRMLMARKRIQDQLIAKLKSKLQTKNQVIADQCADIEIKDQVIAKQSTDIQMLYSNNIPVRSPVPASPSVQSPSSSNVPHNRSREEILDTMPQKVFTLEAESKLSETLAEKNRMLEEKIQMQDQLIPNLKTMLQTADQVIANQKADIRKKEKLIAEQDANIRILKSVYISKQSNVPAPWPVSRPSSWNVSHKRSREQVPTDTTPKNVAKLGEEKKLRMTAVPDQVISNLKRKLHKKNQFIANQNATLQIKDQLIVKQNANIQMKDQVIAKLNADIQMLKSNNVHMRWSYVPAPPLVPRPSSSNMTASSRHVWK